jgi:hypothetical protein
MKTFRTYGARALRTAALVLIVDQATKLAVRHLLDT